MTGDSDGLVGELLKYGGSGMVCLLEQLFSVARHEEAAHIIYIYIGQLPAKMGGYFDHQVVTSVALYFACI